MIDKNFSSQNIVMKLPGQKISLKIQEREMFIKARLYNVKIRLEDKIKKESAKKALIQDIIEE